MDVQCEAEPPEPPKWHVWKEVAHLKGPFRYPTSIEIKYIGGCCTTCCQQYYCRCCFDQWEEGDVGIFRHSPQPYNHDVYSRAKSSTEGSFIYFYGSYCRYKLEVMGPDKGSRAGGWEPGGWRTGGAWKGCTEEEGMKNAFGSVADPKSPNLGGTYGE